MTVKKLNRFDILVLGTRPSMRKIKQRSVMVKNLCVSVCKIDTKRERGTKKRYIPNSNNYNINNNL